MVDTGLSRAFPVTWKRFDMKIVHLLNISRTNENFASIPSNFDHLSIHLESITSFTTS